MLRITRPGGWIVVVYTDWGTLSFDTSEVDIERRLVRLNAEKRHNNGYAGRQSYRLIKRSGLTDIVIKMISNYVTHYAVTRQVANLDEIERVALETYVLTSIELDRWHLALEQAEEEGVFFSSVSLVMAAGRKALNMMRSGILEFDLISYS
jgi:hypothetical protein